MAIRFKNFFAIPDKRLKDAKVWNFILVVPKFAAFIFLQFGETTKWDPSLRWGDGIRKNTGSIHIFRLFYKL
jgi:hypothetical protein